MCQFCSQIQTWTVWVESQELTYNLTRSLSWAFPLSWTHQNLWFPGNSPCQSSNQRSGTLLIPWLLQPCSCTQGKMQGGHGGGLLLSSQAAAPLTPSLQLPWSHHHFFYLQTTAGLEQKNLQEKLIFFSSLSPFLVHKIKLEHLIQATGYHSYGDASTKEGPRQRYFGTVCRGPAGRDLPASTVPALSVLQLPAAACDGNTGQSALLLPAEPCFARRLCCCWQVLTASMSYSCWGFSRGLHSLSILYLKCFMSVTSSDLRYQHQRKQLSRPNQTIKPQMPCQPGLTFAVLNFQPVPQILAYY